MSVGSTALVLHTRTTDKSETSVLVLDERELRTQVEAKAKAELKRPGKPFLVLMLESLATYSFSPVNDSRCGCVSQCGALTRVPHVV